MATTTNYSWTTPDDTALVKDGAAAIRTLGSSADTTVKALNPGTTAGDIDYYTTATTKARIAIGTAGQVLQVNSGATAPEWATSSSGGMTLISTTTLTGASITLSSIPQTYKNLQIIIRNFKPASDNRTLKMRFNSDSNADRHRNIIETTLDTSAQLFNETSVAVAASNDNSTATGLNTVLIPDYTNATTWKISHQFGVTNDPTTVTSLRQIISWGFYNQTGAITSLDFFASSGNLTSGEVLLYGVK